MTRLLTGRTIAGYEVRGLIGRGGMSEVYEAFDPRLDRTVAFKVLTPELARNNSFRERFIRESHTAASLSHPNIIPIFEAGSDEDILYIAMLLVPGYDVGALIEERGRLDLQLTREIVEQAAGALDCAHNAGLLHRDVKPANLLLTRGVGDAPHVYLTDFGLTKSLGRDSRITETGQLMGSVHYVSPEHVDGKEMDRRADVYSLGCVLFECLTGTPPYERESDMAVLWAHIGAEIPRASKRNRRLPDLVDRVLARALAKEPGERFATCGELAESFASALEGVPWNLPTQAPRPKSWDRKRVAALARRAASTAAAISLVAAAGAWGMGAFIPERSPSPVTAEDARSGERSAKRDVRSEAESDSQRRAFEGKKREGSARRDGPSQRLGVAGRSFHDANDRTDVDTGLRAGRGAGPRLVATRTLDERYDVTAGNLRGLRDCSPDDAAQGCIVFDLNRDETFADVDLRDDAGMPVSAWLRQDADGDGRWEGSWIPVCGHTPDPVRLGAGARVQVLLDPQACNTDAQPTTGLIELTLYRRSS